MNRARERVLVIALEDHRQAQMVNDLGRVVRAGGDALLICRDRSGWPTISRGVTVFDLARLFATTWPTSLLAADPGSWARQRMGRTGTVSTAPWWPSVTTLVGRRTGLPLMEWRLVRRRVLPELQPETLTQIIPTTTAAWPIAWHLARLSPGAELRTGLNRDALQSATTGDD